MAERSRNRFSLVSGIKEKSGAVVLPLNKLFTIVQNRSVILLAVFLVACNFSQSTDSVGRFINQFSNFKTVVLDFYYTEGKLPEIRHERQLQAAIGFWHELVVEGPGKYRFDLDINQDKKLPVYILVSERNPASHPPLEFQCLYRDKEFATVFNSSFCRYSHDLPVKQTDTGEKQEPSNGGNRISAELSQRYREELHVSQLLELEHCLKEWGIAWKLPYAPILSGRCESEAASSSGESPYFTGQGRKTIVHLNIDYTPLFSGQQGRDQVNDKLTAVYAHFEALFTRQGFSKVAGDFPHRTSFMRTAGEKPLRVYITRQSSNTLELLLEQVRVLKSGVKLPQPPTEGFFNFFKDGGYGNLFLLPQGRLAGEEIVGGYTIENPLPVDGPPLFITPYWDEFVQYQRSVNMPSNKLFTFHYPNSITLGELIGAYREVLNNAGWQIHEESGHSIRASYALTARTLLLILKIWDENERVVRIELGDPLFSSLEAIVTNSLSRRYDYIFTPIFSADNSMTALTELQISVLQQHLKRNFDSPREGLAFSPVLAEADKNNPELLAQAVRETQKIVDVFLQTGIPAHKVRLVFEPEVAKQASKHFHHGARVEDFFCRTVQAKESKENADTCECRTHFKIIEVIPGACQ
ncbi:hypothetical protein [Candidatus Methylobacter oryzae]|uniref:Uncharacterized protein n=1 Tax=Candidatus Methylobacter oryzae TaxID=2497749 RepID=A0ABY3C692_9GAMM|nr:hypothetical protein [Candidatus Methylobacter oryzae]TRW90792.1 hypothetical protein EKO24_018525 [Candidatus Methylobacter oryzae]